MVADFRPLRALRFQPGAGDPADLIAPPYDVVSAAAKAALYARSEHNIARIDYGEEFPGDDGSANRYTRARDLLRAWSEAGVLAADPEARFYVYDQEFSVGGTAYRRRALFGRLRLEEWEKGIVLPHERTLAAAKADRLELLRATHVHLSPVMALYRNAWAGPIVEDGALGPPALDATPSAGERHVLRPVAGRLAATAIEDRLAASRLYVADGHHRYETALFYRDERKALATSWSGEEGENFVLAALIDVGDLGLVVLPIHRIVELAGPKTDLTGQVGRYFAVEEVAQSYDAASLRRLGDLVTEAGKRSVAFGAIGLRAGCLHLLTARDRAAIDALVPQDHAAVWRALDVNALHHVVLPVLADEASRAVQFTDDAAEVLEAVRTGANTVGFLLNPTGVDQVLDCADAGERMPEKSTFFYPKLATGVLMYPMG